MPTPRPERLETVPAVEKPGAKDQFKQGLLRHRGQCLLGGDATGGCRGADRLRNVNAAPVIGDFNDHLLADPGGTDDG